MLAHRNMDTWIHGDKSTKHKKPIHAGTYQRVWASLRRAGRSCLLKKRKMPHPKRMRRGVRVSCSGLRSTLAKLVSSQPTKKAASGICTIRANCDPEQAKCNVCERHGLGDPATLRYSHLQPIQAHLLRIALYNRFRQKLKTEQYTPS